jgi:hypothetical protein
MDDPGERLHNCTREHGSEQREPSQTTSANLRRNDMSINASSARPTFWATGLIALLFALPSVAQMSEQLYASVPFSFIAAGRSHVPGNYAIDGDGSILRLRSLESRRSTLLAPISRGSGTNASPSLSFLRYPDGQIFLRRLNLPSGVNLLSPSKLEAELMKGLPLAHARPEPIAIQASAR